MSQPTARDHRRADTWARARVLPPVESNDAWHGYSHGQADERARIVAVMRERAGDSPSVSWVADAIESGEL